MIFIFCVIVICLTILIDLYKIYMFTFYIICVEKVFKFSIIVTLAYTLYSVM